MSIKRYAQHFSIASASPVIEFAARLLRTAILSRVLTPNDMGASVGLVTILVSCEFIADVGLDKIVLVRTGAERERMLAAIRLVSLIRGLLLACVLIACAPVLAAFVGAGEHIDSVRWLALVPVIRSFKNWRITQIQADHRYGPETVANVAANLVAVASIFPAVMLLPDERAMIASLVVESLIYSLLSHLLVERVRRVPADRKTVRTVLVYGLPLMVNGLGLVVLSQLDRFVVGHLFGLESLALYTLVLTLAIVPFSPIIIVVNRIGLAFLARWANSGDGARDAAFLAVSGLFIVAAVYAIGIGTVLQKLVPLVFGARYQVDAAFSALTVALAFTRGARSGPSVVLLAHSETKRLTIANLLAGVGLIAGLVMALLTQRVEAVLVGNIIGDVCSLVLLLSFSRRYLALRPALSVGALLALGVAAIVGAQFAAAMNLSAMLLLVGSAAAIVGIVSFGQYRWLSHSLLTRRPA